MRSESEIEKLKLALATTAFGCKSAERQDTELQLMAMHMALCWVAGEEIQMVDEILKVHRTLEEKLEAHIKTIARSQRQ